jgi:hypothetical protein
LAGNIRFRFTFYPLEVMPMALYTNEFAAEAMRERARSEIERAKRMASLQRERRRGVFQEETWKGRAAHTIDAGVLQSLTRAELYGHAKRIGVRGRSKMNKHQLVEAVRHAW